MKRVVLLFALLISGLSFAQEAQENTYEKAGDLVAVTTYYADGSVKEKGYFKDKKPHGEWIMYNQDGVRVVRAHYENGEKVGKWMFMNNNVLTEVDYQDNRVASVHKWNGNIASN